MTVRARTLLLGAAGVVAASSAWALYQRAKTETAPSTVVARLDGVELRRYPATVHAETVAEDERAAFGRLFRYIAGANEDDERIAMTAPVEVAGRGTEIPMTAPVEVEERSEGVRMAFVLPASYDVERAPLPTDPAVELVAVPERTLAVRRFGWRPTDERVARETQRLRDVLAEAGVRTVGDPFFMGYDAPWTPPFLRRNEVAVAVES